LNIPFFAIDFPHQFKFTVIEVEGDQIVLIIMNEPVVIKTIPYKPLFGGYRLTIEISPGIPVNSMARSYLKE